MARHWPGSGGPARTWASAAPGSFPSSLVARRDMGAPFGPPLRNRQPRMPHDMMGHARSRIGRLAGRNV
jgi:hypothetical protein